MGSWVWADKNTASGPRCQSPNPKTALLGIYCDILKAIKAKWVNAVTGTVSKGLRSITNRAAEPVVACSHLRRMCLKYPSSRAS